MGEEADADWDAGLVEWGIEDALAHYGCPIENPHACLATRCHIFGVCQHNLRRRRKSRRHQTRNQGATR